MRGYFYTSSFVATRWRAFAAPSGQQARLALSKANRANDPVRFD
jgi:hypothetical protein